MNESPSAIPVLLQQVALLLNPQDDVAIARADLAPGTVLILEGGDQTGTQIPLHRPIPAGHKVALREIVVGEPVHRYGQVIGFATQIIAPGDHVHSHNLDAQAFSREYSCGNCGPIPTAPGYSQRSFLGYQRPDGQLGTRNYLAVIASVNCSAHTTQQIARHFSPDRLAAHPNVSGIVAFTHPSGCTTGTGSPDHVLLQRTLAGIVRHPNIGASLIVGLGCETNQIPALIEEYNLAGDSHDSPSQPFSTLTIQDAGGIRRTIQAGIAVVEEMLPAVNAARRTSQPISGLKIALQCGGSDGWSGVTANPLVGLVSDEVVRQGGTVVLAETPEIYGAEHLLAQRAASPQVCQQLVDKVRWWEQHTQRLGAEINNNPSPGNKEGGLTTIYEKSLGAIAKGGSTPLMAVYRYAEPVTSPGLTFMDSPGNDPVSVTGQMASGCNLVLFTTGRGSVFGSKPAPTIKVCSNSRTYRHLLDDMDFNAGVVLEAADMRSAAAHLLDLVIDVASGQPSKSEAQGLGELEFTPWHLGGTL